MTRLTRFRRIGIDVSRQHDVLLLRYKSYAVRVYAVLFTAAFVAVCWSTWYSGPAAFISTLVIGTCVLSLLWTRPTRTEFAFDSGARVFRHTSTALTGTSQMDIAFSDVVRISIVAFPRNGPAPSYVLTISHAGGNIPVTDQTFGKRSLKYWQELAELLQVAVNEPPFAQ